MTFYPNTHSMIQVVNIDLAVQEHPGGEIDVSNIEYVAQKNLCCSTCNIKQ
jgi:hypothetical protein